MTEPFIYRCQNDLNVVKELETLIRHYFHSFLHVRVSHHRGVVEWCEENFGPDGMPYIRLDQPFLVDPTARWTWFEDDFYFKLQQDMILFKLKFL